MTAVLSLRGVTVTFGACVADRDVSIDVEAGEIHAIVGENGAGKSTLLRAACGLVPLAAGEIRIGGERLGDGQPASPAALAAEAQRRGVGMVHQHFLLVGPLTVAENVTLGSEPIDARFGPLGVLDRSRAESEVAAEGAARGLAVDPRRVVDDLSVGEAQRVEILRAIHRGARVLLLDEPTAVLSPPEVEPLFRLLRRLRDDGAAVVLVTHKLDEIEAVADRITVLRRGAVTARFARGEAGRGALVRAMVGRDPVPVDAGGRAPVVAGGEPRLRLERLTVDGRAGAAVRDVSLEISPGEVLGIAGVEGNGQTELIEAIAGLRAARAGRVLLDGADLVARDVAARRALGVAHVPEDRHRRGLLLELDVAENLLLGREARFTRPGRVAAALGVIDRGALERDARARCDDFAIRAEPSTPVGALSGGNQQKLVVARELSTRPRLLLAAQPTRGVDVGAIERIHGALLALRQAGGSVLLVSAELDELLALSDRIAVMHRGALVAVLPRASATTAVLGAHMTGGSS